MMNNQPLENDIQSPSILFRLNGGLYCADSRHISTIMELPEYTTLPDTPPYITGIFPLRGNSITMFDLRAALKQRSLSEEFDEFTAMTPENRITSTGSPLWNTQLKAASASHWQPIRISASWESGTIISRPTAPSWPPI